MKITQAFADPDDQLRSISKELKEFIGQDHEGLSNKDQVRLLGYCEQLNIIASKIAKSGWVPARGKCLDCGVEFDGSHTCNITYKL